MLPTGHTTYTLSVNNRWFKPHIRECLNDIYRKIPDRYLNMFFFMLYTLFHNLLLSLSRVNC